MAAKAKLSMASQKGLDETTVEKTETRLRQSLLNISRLRTRPRVETEPEKVTVLKRTAISFGTCIRFFNPLKNVLR